MFGIRRNYTPPYSDCFPVLTPQELISCRKKQINTIQQLAGVPKAHWRSLYLEALLSFAGYVQQLPASESHHHPGVGGLLDHCLEVVIHALRNRRGHLLPQGGDAEEITAKKDVWTYAVFSAALLHDAGKPLMDQTVTLYDKHGRELGVWNALTTPITDAHWYRIRYRKDRLYRLHERAALLLTNLILPAPALDWLSTDRTVLAAWLASISGVYEDAGIIGEIVQQADGLSVAENLGASVSCRPLPGARTPLHERFLTGLRYLFKENQIPLNRNGAAAWFDGKYLWLVSKRGIDTLREHLIQEGHSGIPTRNDRIFDELQQNKVLIANGDRSIWKVNVSGEDWAHTLTCLCFAAEKIWPDPSSRPDKFEGSVAPESDDIKPTTEKQLSSLKEGTVEEQSIHKPDIAVETNTDKSEIEFDPVTFFSQNSEIETAIVCDNTEDKESSQNSADDEDAGQAFRAWLHDGLLKDKFETNSVNARIHSVAEGLLLVSPGIFKDYDKANWQHVQKRFQKLKLHRKTAQGTNIYTYQVTGKRNKSRIKGFLIEEPGNTFPGVKLPSPNTHLELLGD
ncbi:MAG: MobH family relaxase [Candidatus Thiodiazotropha sp. 6PDIVS]